MLDTITQSLQNDELVRTNFAKRSPGGWSLFTTTKPAVVVAKIQVKVGEVAQLLVKCLMDSGLPATVTYEEKLKMFLTVLFHANKYQSEEGRADYKASVAVASGKIAATIKNPTKP
jgi:hypothetical protein